MNAFVIKNKKGKYFESQCIANGEPRFYTNQFLVFTNKNEAKSVLENIAEDCDYFNISCEVVKITIAEGDLEHKIAVLERALKNTCWLLYGTYDEHYPNYFIEKAKKELKGEKDE